MGKNIIKLKTVFRQNATAFFVVFLWFVCNYIYFSLVTGNFIESGLILFYFKPHDSLYGNFYANFSEFVIFGLIFSLITIELFRKYNPVDTCRELAKGYSNHAVIIGYNHVGKRIAEFLKEKGKSVVIIEKDSDKLSELVDKEQPLVNDDALLLDTLKDAGVANAKAVYVMTDNIEVQMVVNAHVRKLNKTCKLITRVFEDDIGEVISKAYNATLISTSKFAASVIFEKIQKHQYRNILLIGMNHITTRLMHKFKSLPEIQYKTIEEDEELIEEMLVERNCVIQGDPKDLAILEQADIKNVDCVVITNPDVTSTSLITKRIRDFNMNCKIIARFFLDSVAEILEKSPFRAEVISSSMDTLKIMNKKGLLDF